MLSAGFLNNKNKGFTLIELLVVISIISVLSTVVTASLQDARKKGNAAKALEDMNQIRNAAEMYRNDTGIDPWFDATNPALVPKYLPKAPVPPYAGSKYQVLVEKFGVACKENYAEGSDGSRVFVYIWSPNIQSKVPPDVFKKYFMFGSDFYDGIDEATIMPCLD